jgi:maltose alpha-D-glucosyltransferase/alpha-amylase
MRDGGRHDSSWQTDAVIYQLHVRTFADSNGDGIGDFPGLITKLDYLADLGITCLWLMPFYESPLRDDGYDVSHGRTPVRTGRDELRESARDSRVP